MDFVHEMLVDIKTISNTIIKRRNKKKTRSRQEVRARHSPLACGRLGITDDGDSSRLLLSIAVVSPSLVIYNMTRYALASTDGDVANGGGYFTRGEHRSTGKNDTSNCY